MLVPRDGLRLNSGPDLVTLLLCFIRLGREGENKCVEKALLDSITICGSLAILEWV